MAKTNISFNNKNYTIDEASLSAASSALKSHFSTVMNGTGATIKLGGTAYNIDSTKLSAATTDFTSYLRTVAGTGSKVVVNGSEYNIGTDKIASAIADLKTVLGNLESGSTSTEFEEILPERTYGEFYDDKHIGISYQISVNEDFYHTFVIGNTYYVKWDDVMYQCVAQDVSGMGFGSAIALGNGANWGYEGNNEPFGIIIWIDPIVDFISFTDTEEGGYHTVSIYKGYGNETVEPEVIFPEQTLDGFEYSALGYSLGLPETFNLVAGETYSVQWGEDMYSGLTAYEAQIDGAPCVYIGNGIGLGYPGNNESFAIISFDGYELLASYVPISSQKVAIYKGIYGESTNGGYALLPERTLTFAYNEEYNMNGASISTDTILFLIPSQEYRVIWGDAEYNLIATEHNRENGDDAVIIILGNPVFANPEYQDNGLPFAIADIPLLNGSICVTNEDITSKKVAIYA